MQEKVHVTLKRYSTNKNTENLAQKKIVSKNYKKTLKQERNTYRLNLLHKLRNMKSNDPRSYMKMIFNKPKTENPIPIDVFYDHFKDLNEADLCLQEDPFDIENYCKVAFSPKILSEKITYTEISKCIKNLKNNKAPGKDGVINEQIKNAPDCLIELLQLLFNVIFDSGIIPSSWAIGSVVPLYKNKGDKHSTDNYRGITLLSCLGKLFTSILNGRLTEFDNKYHIIKESQAGFRQAYSTTDHLFTLRTAVDFYLNEGKKVYCCFVDYRKAFDNIWRPGLFKKMIDVGVGGKMFRAIYNLYKITKSSVLLNGELSRLFKTVVGVSQGEILSPFLFNIYLNDLDSFLSQHKVVGLKRLKDDLIKFRIIDQTSDNTFLPVIKYADDTVLMAESAEDLQHSINALSCFCEHWKLQLNIQKTKVLVFSKQAQDNLSFKFNNNSLEIVKQYNYLGITFDYSGNFTNCIKRIEEQASKSMFAVLKQSRSIGLTMDIQKDIFNKIVAPVLLYGCEIWGSCNYENLEKLKRKYYKVCLNLRDNASTDMLFGDLGETPLNISINTRMISYWSKLLSGKKSKIAYLLCKLIYTKQLKATNAKPKSWIKHIEKCLNNSGMREFWLYENYPNFKWLKERVKRTLIDQYKQYWKANIESSSKCDFYKLNKIDHSFEFYFLLDVPFNIVRSICHFRISNHKLPIETGRWINIPRNQRYCPLCTNNEIGDEIHYLFICPFFQEERKLFIPDLLAKSTYDKNILQSLFNKNNDGNLQKIGTFIHLIMNTFNNLE